MDNGGVNNHQRTMDQMNDAIANGNIGFDNFGHNNAGRVFGITHNGVRLHVGYITIER